MATEVLSTTSTTPEWAAIMTIADTQVTRIVIAWTVKDGIRAVAEIEDLAQAQAALVMAQTLGFEAVMRPVFHAPYDTRTLNAGIAEHRALVESIIADARALAAAKATSPNYDAEDDYNE